MASSPARSRQVLFFVKDGNLFDGGQLTHTEVTRLFTLSNLPDELDDENEMTKEDWELGDAEDDGDEISFNEFCKLLARICNCKIPPENRGGNPFEVTLNNWLGLQIIPNYNRILKDKARGIGQGFS